MSCCIHSYIYLLITLLLKSIGLNESVIELNEPAGKYSLKIRPKTREVKWFVRYSGLPIPTLTWRDTHGNEIPWVNTDDEAKDLPIFAIKDEKRTILKIKYPQISDSGYYTLHADNGRIEKEQKFELKIIGRKRPTPYPDTNANTNPTQEIPCSNCNGVSERLRAAEYKIKQLELQLEEAKTLNKAIRKEESKYRELYLNNCNNGGDIAENLV